MTENKNFILAVVLSIAILVAWQAFYAGPKMREEQAHREAVAQLQAHKADADGKNASPHAAPTPSPQGTQLPKPAATLSPAALPSRETALVAAPRIPIDTPSLQGSISLRGGRIDDLVLRKFRVTTDPNSAPVTLLSPSGSPEPYYAEFGWVAGADQTVKVPGPDTLWQRQGDGVLTPKNPVNLVWDNGEGLIFKRAITVDDNYMFSVTQSVVNNTGKPVELHPYGQVARLYLPQTAGFYVLHEGPVGVLGEKGLQEPSYKDAVKNYDPKTQRASESFSASSGWLGFTDKYWAAVLVPKPGANYQASMYGTPQDHFYANYLNDAVTVAPGSSHSVTNHLFAGAKETSVIDAYSSKLNIKNFDRLIDWGWFYFITKPMFFLIDFIYKLVGNFGVSILLVTVLVKLAFFPLANKSYKSMSTMKLLQPEMTRIRERFKDDKMRQQQAMMELYKKEKVNPMAGCLPIVIQIPVFFALYKVLFVTIEMRHAPFFGWIHDLSAPDPTSLFTLFGLIPWTPPHMLMLGVWPIIMGITMWVQMKLNPAPPDPMQQKIFTYMPVLFTFMLAQFPAGLVIYWSWNNTLSIIQQWVIMNRQGVKVDLFENMGFRKKAENGRSRSPAE